jgi:hypothetical protein
MVGLNDAGAERVARVVAGVVQQAVADTGAHGVVVLEPDSPEGRLVVAWSVRGLGSERVWRVDAETGAAADVTRSPDRRDEFRRGIGRVMARERNGLLMHPANKTALLLDPWPPPEPVLPLGDLYATHVAALAGGAWTGSDELRALADAAGGIDALDEALAALVEGRAPVDRALGHLPESARGDIVQRWEAGRFWRRRSGLVPKLGPRTLGIDLFA